MDRDDSEHRIAALERQLAEGKRAVRQTPEEKIAAVEGSARRFAEALRATLHPGGPSAAEVAGLREESIGVAVDAGLSQALYSGVLRRVGLPLVEGTARNVGGLDTPIDKDAVVRQALLARGLGPVGQPGFPGKPPRPRLERGDRVGAVIGAIGGGIGLCVGGAAALTAAIPASALWMSAIVCDSQYHLTYDISGYSYRPGQSGTSVTFQCVSGAGSYDVNTFAVMGLQSLLAVLVVCTVGCVIWRLARKRA